MLDIVKKIFIGLQNIRVHTINDEYIRWLTYANAGMINKGNIYAMQYAIERISSQNPIIEIGSFCGLSTNIMSYLLSLNNRNNKIVTCDRWIFETSSEGYIGKSNILHSDYRDFVRSNFIRNIDFFSTENKPYTIEAISDHFFELWRDRAIVKDIISREIQLGGSISFCYVDGNHTYEFAKRDFENVDYFLEVGGYILFDDSYDMNPFQLSKLMKDICKNKRYKLIMKNPNYLFIKLR